MLGIQWCLQGSVLPFRAGFPRHCSEWLNMLKFSAKHRLLKCQPLSRTSSETHKAQYIRCPDNAGPGTEQILSQPEHRNNYIPCNSAVLHFCFLAIIPWQAPLQTHTDGLAQRLCGRTLGCMWASSNSALHSPYAGVAEWLPWHAWVLKRKELLHTDRSAMTFHGQLRNQRGALCGAWPPPGSLRHGGKHRTMLLPSVGVCKRSEQGRRGSPVRPCHGRGSLWCSSSKQSQAGCFGSCPVPAPQGSRGSNRFAEGENSAVTYHSEARYLLQICFSGFLPLSLSLCFLLSFFYILSAQNKTVSMSNVLCREVGCRGTGIPAPDLTWRGSTGGGWGRKHNRPCSDGPPDAETWSEQTNKVKAVKLNDYICFFVGLFSLFHFLVPSCVLL